MQSNASESDILRLRLKEYRDLLEICYHLVSAPPEQKHIDNLLKKLREHGIGDTTQRPIVNREDAGL